MTPHPPLAARLMLSVCATQSQQDALLGDLEEEFVSEVLPAGGPAEARRWDWAQALRSAPALLGVRCWNGELPSAMLAAFLCAPVPLWLLESLRSFILSNIPLKEDIVFSTPFLLLCLACTPAFVALGSLMHSELTKTSPRQSAFWIAFFASAADVLWIGTGPARHPIWFCEMLCAVIVVAACCGAMAHGCLIGHLRLRSA